MSVARELRTVKEMERLLTKHFSFGELAAIEDREIERQLKKLADRPSEQLHALRHVCPSPADEAVGLPANRQ